MEGSAPAAPQAPTQGNASPQQNATQQVANQVRAQVRGPGRADVPRGEVKQNVASAPPSDGQRAAPTGANGKQIEAPAQDAATEAQRQDEQMHEWRGKKYTKSQIDAMLGRALENSKALNAMEQKRREVEAKTANLTNLLERFKGSPDEFFKEAGMDEEQAVEWLAKTYYEKRLRPRLEQEQLTPEQAELKRVQRERDEVAQELKRIHDEQHNAVRQQKISQHIQRLESEAMELAKSEYVSAFPGVAYAAAGVMEEYETAGVPISLADAIGIVKNKVNAVSAHYLTDAPVEDLIGMYGQDTIHALSKKLFAYARAKRMEGVQQPEVVRRPMFQRQNQQEERSEKPLTAADIQRRVDSKLGRR